MKKTKISRLLPFLLILMILLFTLAACNTASAGSKGLAYTSNEDGTCRVSGLGECQDSDIIIPQKSPEGNLVTSIEKKAFAECDTIKSITIPSSVTTIGREAFYHCSSLVSVSIPEGVTNIETEAFRFCEKLEEISIPEGVEKIAWMCFDGCASLKSIYIPSTVTKIDPLAFSNCNLLESMTVAPNNPVFHSNGNCIIKTSSKTLVRGCKTSIIPDDGSVTLIGSNAFSFCDSLTEISIPDCVHGFGIDAFNYCESLKSAIVPSGVTELPEKIFHHCNSMVCLTLPNTITRIDRGAISECVSLTEIVYDGTMEQWWEVDLGEDWCMFAEQFVVKCTDGIT